MEQTLKQPLNSINRDFDLKEIDTNNNESLSSLSVQNDYSNSIQKKQQLVINNVPSIDSQNNITNMQNQNYFLENSNEDNAQQFQGMFEKSSLEENSNNRAFKEILEQTQLEISRNVSSALSDSDYFKQDSVEYDEMYTNMTKSNCCRVKLSGSSSSYAAWSWRQFFEFFFYHLVFYILGPFCIIIFYPFNGLYLYKNLGFNLFGEFFFFQTFMWFLNISITIFFFAIKHEREYFEFFQIYGMWIMLLFRIFSISCKYAMFHPIQVQLYRKRFLSRDEKVKDFYLEDWRKQKDNCVMEELYSASKRNEIDLGLFSNHFFQESNTQEIKVALGKLKDQHVEFMKVFKNKHNNGKNIMPQKQEILSEENNENKLESIEENLLDSKDEYSYHGVVILHHLVNQFNKIYPIYNTQYIPIFFGFLKSIIWVVFFSIYNPDKILEMGWLEFIVGAEIVIFNFMLYFVIGNFLLAQLADVHRIYYLNIQMLFLIKPRKDENFLSYKKVLPTLNLTCSNSIKNWIQIRKLSSEYGKKYWLRGQANTSFMALYSLYPLIFIFLHLLDIFTFCLLNLWYLIFDFAVIFTFVSISLYYTASINYQFTYHAQILEEIRIIFRNLLREDILIQKDELCSYLYRTILRKLRHQCSNNKDLIVKRIKQIIHSIDDVKNELVLHQTSQPFECFGFTVTFTRLKNAILFLSSFLTLSINVYIKTHEK